MTKNSQFKSTPRAVIYTRVSTEGQADYCQVGSVQPRQRTPEHDQEARRTRGGTFGVLRLDFADTPEGDLQFGILGSFAEYKRKVTRLPT